MIKRDVAGTRRTAPDSRRSRVQLGAHHHDYLDLAVTESESGRTPLSCRVGDWGRCRDRPQYTLRLDACPAATQRPGSHDCCPLDSDRCGLDRARGHQLAKTFSNESKSTGLQGWLFRVDSFGVLVSFSVAVLLNLRPKGLLLGMAAGLALHAASVKLDEALVLIVIYTVIATSTVVIPIVASLVAPRRMEPKLLAARDWMTHNGRLLTSLMMFMIGVVILGYGLTQL